MKKTRKLLSVVLSVLIAFASMPMVYTATVASDISAYAAAQKGTIDNPTDPVSESGEYSQHETNQLSYSQKSLNFTYYQTMNDEYFHLYQAAQMEKYCGSMTASVSVTLGDYTFADDAMTSEFMKSYYESHAWVAGTGASEAVAFPDGFELDGNYWTGCEDYSWSLGVVFKGASADKTGTFTTGYTQNLVYTTNVDDVINNYETPITTTITVLDARELVEKIAEAEAVVANPDGYTKEYVSSVQATLNSVPDDLKDFSAVYSQDVIDGFVNDFENISKNSADYTEYNRLYASLKAINNGKGAYTSESFDAFKAEITRIDKGLSKTLDKTQQATVDAATQSLREAFSILIYTDLSTSNTGASISGDGDMNFVVDNTAFRFMQTKDNQVFQYKQMWTISRTGGNTARNFGGMILDESLNCMDSDCMGGSTISPNGTTAYISRLTDDSYELITAVNEKDSSITANEFTCWEEYTDASATALKDSSDIVDRTGTPSGTLDANRDYAYDQNSTYYLQNSPKFIGNPAGTYGEFSMSYVLRTGWHYKTGGIGGWLGSDNYKHLHINNTIQVTDARQLVSAVDEANATLANPGNHTKDYITALQAAVGSVPVEMYRGVEYYTQAEVDKLYQDITTIPENVADYSEFVEVFEEMAAVNKDKFTEESYNAFIDEIYAINQNLPKNLPADQQSTVDEAVDALYDAYDKIVSAHLNSDNVYTQDDIGVTLGYSPLDFSLSSTQYNFMITADNQQFAVKTDLSLRKTRTDYNCYFRGVGFYAELTDEEAGAGYVAPDCSSDQGCHGLDAIANNQTRIVVDSCTGLEKYSARDDGGNIARHNNWVNTSGPNLITNGTFINDVAVSTTESTAQAELYYTGPTGGNTQEIAVDYVLWLGWWYVQPFFGENLSDKTYRHVHIPVSAKFTDARALNALYGEVEDIINGKTDTDYTFDSLVNVYNAFNNVPADMPNGDTYYTQEEVNAQYAALNSAYEELVEGADYSEYFKAYVKAEEIINSGNTDSRGNALYEEEAYNEFVNTVTGIENGLDKGLTKDEEGKNQAIIDEATSGILGAMDTLNESKYADYSALNDAMTEAEKILNAPEGTYTDKTIEEVKSAYNSAVNLSKTLPESEQAQVDAVASALNAAVNSAEFKADYSEFNDAYSQVQDIVNNPDNYTSATVEAAEKALENADKLDKDLADLAVNRQTVADATQSLQDVINSAEKKADYTDYNNAKSEADSLVNDDGNGNPVYDEDAFNSFKEAVNNIDTALDKDLPESEQETVNQATSDLDELKATLENNKKADYTDFDAAKDALENIVNNPDDYTSATVEAAKNALDEANKIPSNMVVGENNANQNIIDTATDAMQNVIDSAEKKADYTEFDKVVEDLENIVNNPDNYTEEAVKNAQDALDTANGVSKDLPESEQGTLDSITESLKQVVDSAEKKADYTEFDKVVEDLENIVNNPDNYTEETVEKAQEALDTANGVSKDLPESEQGTLDSITESLKQVVDSAEKKADYTEFDKVVEDLENIVNNPDNYTEETVEKAQEALDTANGVSKDLPESEQGTLDGITESLKQVVDSAEKKADYTDYNNAKSEADSLVNDDGNGNPVYDEDAFNSFKEAVNNIDSALDKDLPATEQTVVDEATKALEELKVTLEEKKIYTVTFIGLNGEVLSNITYVNGSAFSTVTAPVLPEATETTAYVGWLNGDVFMRADTVMNGDVTLTIASESTKIIAEDGSTVIVGDEYVTGIDKDTTVAQLKAELQNDETVLEIKHFDGTVLADERLVGTGSTITLKSKYTGEVYETKTIVIYGDLDGDGDVDADDFAKGKESAVADETYYSAEYAVFFTANDVNGDGYIDVLDSWVIGRIQKGKMTVLVAG